MEQALPEHPLLRRGRLANGLRYVVLPNAVPPNRFEAHLEIHAGSVDEGEAEQGVAHLVEHITFLGSKKRERLLGTGARSNAYTDFHHTVFHVHAPTQNATGDRMLPQVLEALDDIAFHPLFLDTRIEKERRAVLAEAQMMNTIEYRVDCQLLQQLHWENALGTRFPIGRPEQIQKWHGDVCRGFHQRWYFPANATLYLVGDIDCDVDAAIQQIEAAFAKEPAPMREEEPVTPGEIPTSPAPPPLPKTRQPVRPPVAHAYGLLPSQADPALLAAVPAGPPPHTLAHESGVHVFQHELLQQFSLSIFCKLPVRQVTSMRSLQRAFILRIVLSVLQFRINARYAEENPSFTSVELDHSDSAREGCAVSTLTVTSEAADWEAATLLAVAESRRLQRYGITNGELVRYRDTLLRDSEQLAQQAGSVPSFENLDFVMESDALGHTVMDQVQGHEALLQVADSITVEDVNVVGRQILGYVADFGRDVQERDEEAGVATAVVACVPAAYNADVDDETEAPFEITSEQIAAVLAAPQEDLEMLEDIHVPEHLIDPERVEQLVVEREPAFVSMADSGEVGPLPPPDPETGVVQRRLSNGMRINYRVTDNEPQAAMLRVIVEGGRAWEAAEPDVESGKGAGAVAIGARALSESGTVGDWERGQVEMFCLGKLINCVLESDEEFISMDFHFAVNGGGLRGVLELVHLMMEEPRWEDSALVRAKQLYLSHYRSLHKSLERAAVDRVVRGLLGGDRRFTDPDEQTIAALSLDGVREVVSNQLRPEKVEVVIAGDFDPQELDALLLSHLGTISSAAPVTPVAQRPIVPNIPVPLEERKLNLFLKDSDERALAYVAGVAPNRWGIGANGERRLGTDPSAGAVVEVVTEEEEESGEETDKNPFTKSSARRAHPLFASVSLALMTEVINSRLFTTVRDALGLTYDVSFELSHFDRLEAGWFMLTVTSTPAKIEEALAASLRVLRGLETTRVQLREIERARRTLLTRHETDLKDNTYWIGLLTHLQSEAVPAKSIACLSDLKQMYEAATIDDIYEAYHGLVLEEDSVYSCVGISDEAEPVAAAPPAAAAAAFDAADASKSPQAAATAAAAMLKGGKLLEALAQLKSIDGGAADINKPPSPPPPGTPPQA